MTEKSFYQQLGSTPPIPEAIFEKIETPRSAIILRFLPLSTAVAIFIVAVVLFFTQSDSSEYLEIADESDQTEQFAYYDPLSEL